MTASVPQLFLNAITNPILLSAIAGHLASQLFKLILGIVTGKGAALVFTGGGMPSSHTATMGGFVISVIMLYGTSGFEFPMAVLFASIVIFDATHVRYQAGLMGGIINHAVKEKAGQDPYYRSLPTLKEHLGHTVPEIIVGAVIGIATGIAVTNLMLHYFR